MNLSVDLKSISEQCCSTMCHCCETQCNVTKSVRKRKIPLTGGKFSRRLETICKLKESQKKHKNNFEKNHKAHICAEKLHSLGIISWTLNKRRNWNLKNNSQCIALQWGLFDQSKDSVALLQYVFFFTRIWCVQCSYVLSFMFFCHAYVIKHFWSCRRSFFGSLA